MKKNLNTMLALLTAGLLIANFANAQWSRNAASQQTFLTNTADFVGIGTNNPQFILDVRGTGAATMSFKSSNGNASFLLDRSGAGFNSSVTYKTNGVNTWQTGIIGNDNYNIRNNVLVAPAVTVLVANNFVGVGLQNPTERLHVSGNILATGNINANGTVTGATVTSTGNVNAVNFFGSGNIDVNGYVGFGSVERLTDGGNNTIASNSSFVPTSDCLHNLGTSALRWNNISACGSAHIGTTTGVVAQLSVAHTTLSGIAGTGSFQIGETNALNLVMDNNEIQSRNNGATNTLFLQFNGGNLDANFGGGNAIFHGSIGVGTSSPSVPLHITSGTDVGLASGGYIVTGTTAGANLGFDNNEIVARNNGAASVLFLNNSDGGVNINGSDLVVAATTGIVTTSGNLNVGGLLDVAGNTITFGSAESIGDVGTNTVGTTSDNITCGSDNSASLGTSAVRWTDVWAVDGTINTSDARDKNNIKNISYGLNEIMKLRPVTYQWNDMPDHGIKIGLIAQELQQVLPEVVRDFEYQTNEETGVRSKIPSARLGVMYSDIIPVIIKGMQEQNEVMEINKVEFDAMKKEIADLKDVVKQLDQSLAQCCMSYGEKSAAGGISTDGARLEQNAPNPFSEKTIVKFYIPQNFKSAMVKIYSMSGDEMKSFNISASGLGQVEISGSTMASGVYQYTLLIDGKAVDSKQMILTK